jgi:adenylyltransferase/sulfurtransferase
MRCLWQSEPNETDIGRCETTGILGVVPGILGTVQALEVLKIILGLNHLKNTENLIINLLDFSSFKLKLSKNGTCPLCSNDDHYMIDPDQLLEISLEEAKSRNYLIVSLLEKSSTRFRINSNLENLIEDTKKIHKNQGIAIICERGVASLEATKILRQNLFTQVYSIQHGIQESHT